MSERKWTSLTRVDVNKLLKEEIAVIPIKGKVGFESPVN